MPLPPSKPGQTRRRARRRRARIALARKISRQRVIDARVRPRLRYRGRAPRDGTMTHARALDRRDRRHDRVPDVLADQASPSRPMRVSNVCRRRPRERNRSSSKTPYVGKNILRCTCTNAHASLRLDVVHRPRCCSTSRPSFSKNPGARSTSVRPRLRATSARDRWRRPLREQREIVDRAFEKVAGHRAFGKRRPGRACRSATICAECFEPVCGKVFGVPSL